MPKNLPDHIIASNIIQESERYKLILESSKLESSNLLVWEWESWWSPENNRYEEHQKSMGSIVLRSGTGRGLHCVILYKDEGKCLTQKNLQAEQR